MEVTTSLKILSHAALLIKRGDISLIIDPWLIGSCYWRSWWNYPEPELDDTELSTVTHVLISHIHWDHWHGVSLKKYFRGREFLIPEEPRTRSYDDLVKLRLGNVNLIKHNSPIYLAKDFKITIYQFGLFFNDSAIVIETPELLILNANDAKIAGSPLREIVSKYRRFDFAFRSHSSANWRSCISIENDSLKNIDDNEHYSRSFKLFMDAVNPKYAVPFASNHCHLHKDTFHFNENITNPIKLKNWLESNGNLQSSRLCIMLPGSTWHSKDGFFLKNFEPYDNINQKLIEYQNKKKEVLTKYYEFENHQILNRDIITKHENHLKSIPWLFRKSIKKPYVVYRIVKNNLQDYFFIVDLEKCLLIETDAKTYYKSEIKIEWPVFVFKQAVILNMYIHAFISKRVRFYLHKKEHLKKLNRFLFFLIQLEHEFFPIRLKYMWRLFLAYCKRWRELFVYITALKEYVVNKRSMPIIEEILLDKSKK